MQTPDSKSAPYGHACANCSRAKCRCILREPGTCERCHRLGKVCPPSAVTRKPKKVKPASRRARLEEQLGDLVSLLRSQGSSLQPSGQPMSPPSIRPQSCWQPSDTQTCWPADPVVAGSSSQAEEAGTTDAASSPSSGDAFPRPTHNALTPVASHYESRGSTPLPALEQTGRLLVGGITQLEAEEYLHIFRTGNLKYFPFTFIPESTTPAEVAETRPFLWLNIVAICTQSRLQQQALSTRIMEILGHQILVKSDRTIDILLGLIAYIGWSVNYTRGRPYLNMLANITMELASDLRLHMHKFESTNVAPTCFKPHLWPTTKGPQAGCSASAHTTEDRRALLSTFLLYSTITSCMRFETARWTLSLDESLAALSAEQESPDDKILVAAARVMQISENAASRLPWRPDDPTYLGAMMLQVNTLENSLENLKSTFSPDLLENEIIRSCIYSTEVVIHKLAIYQRSPEASYGVFDVKRIECLNKCVHASKRVMDLHYFMKMAKFRGIHFMFVVQYSHAAQMLYRLSVLEDRDWDRQAVKQTANIIEYLELAAARVEAAIKELVPGSNQRILFTKGAESLRYAIPIWAAAVDHAGKDEGRDAAAMDTKQTTQGLSAAQPFDPMSMEFFDDRWLTDIFASWDSECQ